MNSKQSRRNQSFLWIAALLLAMTGLSVSLYSAHSHYKNYTDPLYSSFCAISKAVNCDTVAQSPWSIVLDIPVAWWGICFYLSFLFFLMIEDYRSIHAWRSFLRISLIASAATLLLAGISVWKIKSLCLACLATYAVTFALTYTCWIGKRRNKADGHQKKNTLRNQCVTASFFLSGLLLLHLFLPHYWSISKGVVDISSLPHGLTEEGHPWIGAEKPLLTITQFSDYQCFQCGKMYFLLRQFLVAHPTTFRLIHRHYPMDYKVNSVVVPEPFHEGSGDLAKIAILAALRDKFWQTNDLLYEMTRSKVKEIPLKEISDKTELDRNELAAALTHPSIQDMLSRDIWRGMKLGITGTPAFLINGKVYQGHIPAEILKNLAELPGK